MRPQPRNLQQLSAEWIEAKEAERDAIEKRRLIEDELCHLLEVQNTDDGSHRVEAKPYLIKIACRINRKVDGDLAQEIAAEHDMQDHLSLLFRWKPELSMTAWNGVGDNVKKIFARAITATPGRPSFTITKSTIEEDGE
jgi:hypothetical protein